MTQVNMRPDETNKLIDGLMLPIAIKAGMIGSMQINFSLISLWTSPIEVVIDDLNIILGPNLSFVSHDEVRYHQSNCQSYIEDEDMDDSYDSTNVYNIF